MIRLRTASALAAGAVAALALGGTALAAGSDDPSSSSPAGSSSAARSSSSAARSSSSAEPSSSAAASSSSAATRFSSSAASVDAVGLDAAKAIAIRAAGGGRVTDTERETEHGRAVWDVEVLTGGVEHDFDVDRATGEVLRHETDDSSSSSSSDDHGSDD